MKPSAIILPHLRDAATAIQQASHLCSFAQTADPAERIYHIVSTRMAILAALQHLAEAEEAMLTGAPDPRGALLRQHAERHS